MNKHLKNTISHIIDSLVAGNYQKLIDESVEKRLQALDIADAIEEHGILSSPKSDSEGRIYISELEANEILIDYFLHINGEVSDLMLRIIAYKPFVEHKFSIWDIYPQ